MNIRAIFSITLIYLLIQGCTSTPQRPENTTEQDLTQVQAKIDEATAGQFGEFVAEVYQAGEALATANREDLSTPETYAAASKALGHRNKAETAFDALFQSKTRNLSRTDYEQRLRYLESLHVPKDLTIPVVKVYFNFGGHRVQTTEKEKIKEIITFLRQYPVFALKLVGYADTVGSEARNILLAERRNSAVLSALRKQGLPTNTVISVAFGEANGPDEMKNQENRRVEIIPYVHGDYNYPNKE